MRRFTSSYGDRPLHLLAMLASLSLAAYAAVRVVPDNPLGVIIWFVGAAVIHDLLLFPLYAVADRSLLRRRPHRKDRPPAVPWINHVRFPTALSLLLLLIWAPLILRLTETYEKTTAMPLAGYFERWLAVTAALYLLAAVHYAWLLRRRPSSGSASSAD